MIIIRLMGGLGNQMFQYALGRRLSIERNVEFKLDISGFFWDKIRSYRLNKFNIVENFPTEDELRGFLKSKIELKPKELKKIGNLYTIFIPYYRRIYVKERGFPYDPNILKINANAYLDGYWASEKYFIDIENQIRKDFVIKEGPDEANTIMAGNILDTESISIHFRRGDYIDNPKTNRIHGTCSLDYYHKAVEDVLKYVTDPKLYIFSDDPDWVKQNFSIPYPMTFVTVNGPEKDYADLQLMSLCKHHIIANSTFSWWGAWLGKNKDKRIYTPKRWYNVNYNTKDLFPESWIKI